MQILQEAGSSTSKMAKKSVKLADEEQSLFDEVLASQVMVQPMLFNPKFNTYKFAGMKAEKWKNICDKLHQGANSETIASR